MDTATLKTALNTLNQEFLLLQSTLDSLPKTDGDLKLLLAELKDADDDRTEHFKRFPRNDKPGTYNCDVASIEVVQEDWSRCCRRFEMAVTKLLAFARQTVV